MSWKFSQEDGRSFSWSIPKFFHRELSFILASSVNIIALWIMFIALDLKSISVIYEVLTYNLMLLLFVKHFKWIIRLCDLTA